LTSHHDKTGFSSHSARRQEAGILKWFLRCSRYRGGKRAVVYCVHDMMLNISNKVAREKFAADFLTQCLSAIGCKTLHRETI
jgi:Domain of unknown function (DUF6471)